MVQYTPAPEPRELLPPLLACLPSAFVATRPPPDFLPLLSPILRQRVQLLAGNGSTASGSWLPLLCWSSEHATRLPDIVEHIQLEPHPVSGEIELGDIAPAKYRRLDTETLHARFEVEEYGLAPIYLWCMGDESADGHGWRLTELRTLDEISETGKGWVQSITEADEASVDADCYAVLDDRDLSLENGLTSGSCQAEDNGLEDDDDDGYWESYDRTPGRTPTKDSGAPISTSAITMDRKCSASENEYYARYGNEVQPALDAEDPSEQSTGIGESTVGGNELTQNLRQKYETESSTAASVRNSNFGSTLLPPLQNEASHNLNDEAFSHPRPISAASSSDHVARLEHSVADHSQAEVGIRQHISAELKNLFRLARSAGIERSEFNQIVHRELESLSIFEMDE